MKQIGFGKRALALLLALIMVTSVLPMSVLAISKIPSGTEMISQEATGLKTGTNISLQDTISWPIKIYDYLNDGMLFEYAESLTYASDDGYNDDYYEQLTHTEYYSGGKANPFMQGVTPGVDYTVLGGYYNISEGTADSAMSNWGNRDAYLFQFDDNATEVTRSVVAAQSTTSPMYLKNTYSGTGTSQTYSWICDFARDERRYYTADEVRYLVLVYKTDSDYDGSAYLQPYWAVSRSGSYAADKLYFDSRSGAIDISTLCFDNPFASTEDGKETFGWKAEGTFATGLLTAPKVELRKSTTWTYLIVDMYAEGAYDCPSGDNSGNDFLIASNLDKVKNGAVAGIGLGLPLDKSGEELDIAQIACFRSYDAAENFKDEALAYVNNPGTYKGSSVELEQGTEFATPGLNDDYLGSDFLMDSSNTHGDTAFYGSQSLYSGYNYYWSYNYLCSIPANMYNNGDKGIYESSLTPSRRLHVNYYLQGILGSKHPPDDCDQNDYYTRRGAKIPVVSSTNTSSYYDKKMMTTDPAYAADNDDVHYVRYLTIVYTTRNIPDLKLNWWFANTSQSAILGYDGTTDSTSQDIGVFYDVWEDTNQLNSTGGTQTYNYEVIDLVELAKQYNKNATNLSDINSVFKEFNAIGLRFDGMDWENLDGNYRNSPDADQIDVAYCDFFADIETAEVCGQRVTEYSNYGNAFWWQNQGVHDSVTTEVKVTSSATYQLYQMGNNRAFGLLRASNRGGWATTHGGSNSWMNGYYSYPIGATPWYDEDNKFYGATNSISEDYYQELYRSIAGGTEYNKPVSSSIYMINPYHVNGSDPELIVDIKGTAIKEDTFNSTLELNVGYGLYNRIKGSASAFTLGLLEHSLVTETSIDGIQYKMPDYKDETIAYVAQLLADTLVIPESMPRTDNYTGINASYSTLYFYNYVHGTASEQYGGTDLATALRSAIGITASYPKVAATAAQLGTLDATKAKIDTYKTNNSGKNPLIGPFLAVMGKDSTIGSSVPKIQTCYDAAYYLLMNLYVDDSYNQRQNTYSYLRLHKGTLNDTSGTEAYVFDSSFTDEAGNSGVVYDVANRTIGLSTAAAKAVVDNSNDWDTYSALNPFLPIYDAEDRADDPYGPNGAYVQEAGANSTVNAWDSYYGRNFNYALQANGEFIYHYNDSLYFNFEGDDDVYLFINGELVLDIGGAHSSATVSFNMNDYVDAAKTSIEASPMVAKKGFEYQAGEAKFIEVLDQCIEEGLVNSSKRETYIRDYRLYLHDGYAYDIDFYYLERHGVGANMRIATNIVMTDPALKADKIAWQIEEDDTLTELDYGEMVDDSKPILYDFCATNNGNTKLYNLSFKDANIGVNLTPERGLETYGKPTVATFTSESDTTLSIVGLDGVFDLDGTTYYVDRTGAITNADGTSVVSPMKILGSASAHTLTMYQMNADEERLFQDAEVYVNLGTSTSPSTATATKGVYTFYNNLSNKVTVGGVRVSDQWGGVLDYEDLYVTVSGYNSEDEYLQGSEPTFLEIWLSSDEELKDFLRDLTDPAGQTSVINQDERFSLDGIWLHATVTIGGFRYKFTEEDKAAKTFGNTLYAYAYKEEILTASSEQVKSQDQHRVFFEGGEPIFYHWAGHTSYLRLPRIWHDVRQLAGIETSTVYEYRDVISSFSEGINYTTDENVRDGTIELTEELTDGTTNKTRINTTSYYLNMSLCDEDGNAIETTVADGYEYVERKDDYNGVLVEAIKITYKTAGLHTFYIKITHATKSGSIIVPVTVYSGSVQDKTIVLDYGLKAADLNAGGELFKGDNLLGELDTMTAKLLGVYNTVNAEGDSYEPASYEQLHEPNSCVHEYYLGGGVVYANSTQKIFTEETLSKDFGQGTLSISKGIPDAGLALEYNSGKYTLDGTLTYTPEEFMTESYSVWLLIDAHEKTASYVNGDGAAGYHMGASWCADISSELRMYKKVTILPANVVYYEDDFSQITYNTYTINTGTDSESTGTFESLGAGSGSLTQGVDDSQPYGQDDAYKTNLSMSGNSQKKIEINSTKVAMSFQVSGTGFELIGRTDAVDSATIMVEVLDASGKQVRYFPVITRFDNGNDGGAEAIDQVPIVRVDGLTQGTYTVNIYGSPAYRIEDWIAAGGVRDDLSMFIKKTYLYVDGVRIFQPIGATNVNYSAAENGAIFDRIRDQIVAGNIGTISAAGSSTGTLTLNYANITWTENVDESPSSGTDEDGNVIYTGNKVTSADDYLIKGPNNEVYMDSSVSNSALVMFVQKEDGANATALQIAARGIDYGQFYGANSSGVDVDLQVSIYKNKKYAWKTIGTIKGSTEQYYQIPLNECYNENGVYKVVIRAVNSAGKPAMVSFSSMKRVGLKYVQDSALQAQAFDAPTKEYKNGFIVCKHAKHYSDDKTCVLCGETVECTTCTAETACAAGVIRSAAAAVVYTDWNVLSLQQQMSATTVLSNRGQRVDIDDYVTTYPSETPELTMKYASLSFEDEIRYNMYYTVAEPQDIVDMGLLVFNSEVSNPSIENASEIIPGYVTDGEYYMSSSNGIAAKKMGDTLYFVAYAKLFDGTYAYSSMVNYSAVNYAESILRKSENEKMKALVVAMLNYGAEAQKYFGYNTDNLMNAGLSEEAQALVKAYSADTMPDPAKLNDSKNNFFGNDGFGKSIISTSFDSAFALNYYFNTTYAPEGSVTLYYWTEEDYNAAATISPVNATGSVTMTSTGVENQFWGQISGIAAKEMADTIYVGGMYVANGMTYTTCVMNYSLGRYCDTIANREGSEQQDLSKATAVYGATAKEYFDSL